MTDEVPAPLPNPAPEVPEHEKIPESWVEGYTEFRGRMEAFEKRVTEFGKMVRAFQNYVRLVILFLGLAFVAIGIVALISLKHSDHNAQTISTRSEIRNAQQMATDAKLADITAQLQRQEDQLQRQAAQDKLVFCNAIEKSKADAIAAGKPVDPATAKFERDYGCFSLPGAGPSTRAAPR